MNIMVFTTHSEELRLVGDTCHSKSGPISQYIGQILRSSLFILLFFAQRGVWAGVGFDWLIGAF